MIALQRGQNQALPATARQVVARISWSPRRAAAVNVSAFLLGSDGTVRSDLDMIDAVQPVGPDRAVSATGNPIDTLAIDLAGLPASVDRVAIVISVLDAAHGLAGLDEAVVTFTDQDGGPPFVGYAPPIDNELNRALILAEVYRRQDQWKVRAVGQGFLDGLDRLARTFGVSEAHVHAGITGPGAGGQDAIETVMDSPATMTWAGTDSADLDRTQAASPDPLASPSLASVYSRASTAATVAHPGSGGPVPPELLASAPPARARREVAGGLDGISQIGKYRIDRVLGRGAMGVVYLGFDTVIERQVAIKTLLKDIAQEQEGQRYLERFRQEARASGRMTQGNIVTLFDFGEEGDTLFIVMEYVEGRTLRSRFDAGETFALGDTLDIMDGVLSGLDYAHKRGVVHRDIKPANIMIDAYETVKITDFGVARIETSTMTQVGEVLGTPAYMSPEQFTGGAIDHRSDIFSAGVVLYQLLTGARPFSGTGATIMFQILQADPPPPSSLPGRRVPSALDPIVRKAIAKRPDERFQTARAFAEELAAIRWQQLGR